MNINNKTFPCLLLGGLAMRREELLPLSSSLEAKGIHCLLNDNLCVGDGPRIPADEVLTIEKQARHQWDYLDGVSKGPINLFGMSMGGMIAATMFALRPERVNHLIVAVTSANTADFPTVSDAVYNKWFKVQTAAQFIESIELLFGKTSVERRPELKEEYTTYRIKGLNNQTREEFFRQLDAVRAFDGKRIYSSLIDHTKKITLIGGEEDTLLPEPNTMHIAELLGGIKPIILPEIGHMIHVEATEQLAGIILEAIGGENA